MSHQTKETGNIANQLDLLVIQNFSRYGITPEGDVYRLTPAKRGRTANEANYRVSPSIHPKGHQWYVNLWGDDGLRYRLPVKRLLRMAYGEELELPAPNGRLKNIVDKPDSDA